MKALVAIVEDNEAVRDALATILVLEGYRRPDLCKRGRLHEGRP